jgi:hypothetical protein
MNMRGVLDDHAGHFHIQMILCIIFHWFPILLSERRRARPATQTYRVGSVLRSPPDPTESQHKEM